MEQREQRVMIETDRYRITGLLSMPLDGSTQPLRREFVALSLSHVVVTMPSEG